MTSATAPRKRLVVNADDLGYDPQIDRGIFEAHSRGIVKSATAMVDTPFAADALRVAPASLALGLHAVIDMGLSRAKAETELLRQIERFTQLRGAPPTHLDSHKHHHALAELLAALAAVAEREALPVRAIDPAMRAQLRAARVRTTDHFLGDASMRPCWTAERLVAAIESLPDGTTELMCHPGYAPSHAQTSFGVEREEELHAVCDPRSREALARSGAVLISYAEL
ncbi:MAG TPA: ChbG/HpnK family deacetylase [Myxococcales bacterium]|nr:ChbG/HpnK family deacetylase [Myxococcales bacterium]